MLSAKQIGIPTPHYQALISVRDKLRAGDYCYAPKNWDVIKAWYTDKENRRYMENPHLPRGNRLHIFNMGVIFEKADCNSIGCIWGWMKKQPSMEQEGGMNAEYHGDVLERLFYPRGVWESDWKNITPAAAADAIDTVLEAGHVDWEAVAEKHGLSYDESCEEGYNEEYQE